MSPLFTNTVTGSETGRNKITERVASERERYARRGFIDAQENTSEALHFHQDGKLLLIKPPSDSALPIIEQQIHAEVC
ncbi:hypothetical protein DNTS_032049 [Danionella cerebrum]|uniref:Uncharacterized protein n=1 Tax=Danionella cerebrum TaxID=2873325 RepID=A0A553P9L1_9TELE|nr:hypothetical protein DNTS_032049 [Danionella translucida]TRY74358.1 hypothetical protein DNTS_032049 [Danionella translucida]